MKLRNCCLLLVGVWLAASVAAFPREVRTDFDHHANFSHPSRSPAPCRSAPHAGAARHQHEVAQQARR